MEINDLRSQILRNPYRQPKLEASCKISSFYLNFKDQAQPVQKCQSATPPFDEKTCKYKDEGDFCRRYFDYE